MTRLHKKTSRIRKNKEQRGSGLTQSAPLPSLIGIIASDPEDVNDEIKNFLIQDALNKNANIHELYEEKNPLIFLMTDTNLDGESHDYYLDFIDDLSKDGAISYKGPDGTALHYAVNYEQQEYIQKLLENGALINEKNIRGETPLFLAALNSIWDIAEILIGAGADLTLTDNAGRTPLEVVGLNDHNHDEDNANRTREVLCNRGAVGPQCDELRELRNRQLRRQLNVVERMINAMGPPPPQPQIVIPAVSQGSKFVPEQKRENAISRSDIEEGDDIIVITEENGAEFFYELATISQWFATKEAEGNRKTNPMSGLVLRDQGQVSRWTASFQTGGRVKKTLRNRTKKQQWKRRR
jgi:hypothetical protein